MAMGGFDVADAENSSLECISSTVKKVSTSRDQITSSSCFWELSESVNHDGLDIASEVSRVDAVRFDVVGSSDRVGLEIVRFLERVEGPAVP